jgi:hypothetical protein
MVNVRVGNGYMVRAPSLEVRAPSAMDEVKAGQRR